MRRGRARPHVTAGGSSGKTARGCTVPIKGLHPEQRSFHACCASGPPISNGNGTHRTEPGKVNVRGLVLLRPSPPVKLRELVIPRAVVRPAVRHPHPAPPRSSLQPAAGTFSALTLLKATRDTCPGSQRRASSRGIVRGWRYRGRRIPGLLCERAPQQSCWHHPERRKNCLKAGNSVSP